MRRHSSLAVTSAIVLLGGAGVFGGGAISLRASTDHRPLESRPSLPARVAHPTGGRRRRSDPRARCSTISPATTPSPYLFATGPLRLPRVATVRRLGIGTGPADHGGAVARPARLRVGRPIRRGHGQRLLRRLPVRADDVVGARLRRPAERSPARGPESCRRSPAAHRRLVGVAGLLGGRRSVVRPTATRAGSRYCSHHQPCRRGLEAKVVRRGARRSAVRRRHRLDLR